MEEQERRFRSRIHDPHKIWKLSPMDVESYKPWFVYEQPFPQFVPPGATESGFVFTNLRKGARYVPVDILFERHIEGLEFFVSSTGFRADHTAVDFEVRWQEAQKTVLSTQAEVREWVESLPCCATNKTGSRTGGPVDFVIVTSDLAFRQGVMRTGWEEPAAKTLTSSSAGLRHGWPVVVRVALLFHLEPGLGLAWSAPLGW